MADTFQKTKGYQQQPQTLAAIAAYPNNTPTLTLTSEESLNSAIQQKMTGGKNEGGSFT